MGAQACLVVTKVTAEAVLMRATFVKVRIQQYTEFLPHLRGASRVASYGRCSAKTKSRNAKSSRDTARNFSSHSVSIDGSAVAVRTRVGKRVLCRLATVPAMGGDEAYGIHFAAHEKGSSDDLSLEQRGACLCVDTVFSVSAAPRLSIVLKQYADSLYY